MTRLSKPPDPEDPVPLTRDEAELALVALDRAVSHVLEERRPEDRRASHALAGRLAELRARLLSEVAARDVRVPDEDGAEAACRA